MNKLTDKPIKIAIVAGEISGDLLGGSLITALKDRYPNATFAGIGGERMQTAGLDSWFDMETLSVMGLFEVLGRLPTLLKLRRALIKQIVAWQPDVFIGIDAPDFNLGVELKVKQAGIKTLHYVSPSVWAWRQKRVFNIAKATHRVLALLPFEKQFYDRFDVPCSFVGHPLADEIPFEHDVAAVRSELGFADEDRILAMLPGSRRAEVAQLADLFLHTFATLKQAYPELKAVIPCANQQRHAELTEHLQAHPNIRDITLLHGNARKALIASDAVLLASGTAALETMLVNRPMVVSYKTHPITYWLGERLLKIDYVSLPNLLANKALVPELLQHDATVENLSAALTPLLDHPQPELQAQFAQLHQQLRQNASQQAAQAVADVIAQA